MNLYNPKDWYWVVADSATQVFSSKVGDYVPLSDPAYVAWLAGDNVPTRIASEAELGDVLAPHSVRPANAAVLDGYKDSQATKLTVETVAKVTFNHENRIRVLEGKQPASAAQFKQALKDLM